MVYTQNIRVEMSSPYAALDEGHAPHSLADSGYHLSEVEGYLADIRANLLLFEETQDICMGLRDILDSYILDDCRR